MTFTNSVASNNYGCAKWIVSATVGQGSHQTIASALSSASSGDTIFIRPGTYTENLTLKAGVNLAAFECDSVTPNVIILGKATATFAGAATISGIQLKTNSDFALVVSGSSATQITCKDCYLNCNNNTGLSLTSSNASASISFYDSFANLATTGIAYHSSSGAGSISYWNCNMSNTGASITASDCSAGQAEFDYCLVTAPISSSGTAALNFYHCRVDTSAQNATPVTFNGSNVNSGAQYSFFYGGTNPAVTIGASGFPKLSNSIISSSNTFAISGTAGAQLTYSTLNFGGNSANIQTTIAQNISTIGNSITIGGSQSAQNVNLIVKNDSNTGSSQANLQLNVGGASAGDPYQTFTVANATTWAQGVDNSVAGDPFVLSASGTLGTTDVMSAATTGNVNFLTSISIAGVPLTFSQGTFNPTMQGSGTAGTVTMTTQVGRYQKIGRIVNVEVVADWSTLGGATGNPLLNNLPFTVANVTNLNPPTAIISHTNNLATASGAVPFLQCLLNTATANIIYYLGSTGAANNATITASNGFSTQFSYETT